MILLIIRLFARFLKVGSWCLMVPVLFCTDNMCLWCAGENKFRSRYQSVGSPSRSTATDGAVNTAELKQTQTIQQKDSDQRWPDSKISCYLCSVLLSGVLRSEILKTHRARFDVKDGKCFCFLWSVMMLLMLHWDFWDVNKKSKLWFIFFFISV